MPTSIAGKSRNKTLSRADRGKAQGFTYLMVLAAIAALGLVVGAATTVTSRVMQSDREAELLFRGNAYRNAIQSYFEAGVASGRPALYPKTLEELVNDPRFPNKHHLRAPYADPFTGKKEWTLIRTVDGGIAGVASQSTQEPLKKANFPKDYEKFQAAKTYADWVFQYIPPTTVRPNAPSAPPSPSPAVPPVHTTY